MAIFLRGNIWWFEFRNKHERVVKSTGLRKEQKKEAQAVYDAFRLARTTRPPRSAMEKILDSIYKRTPLERSAGLSLDAVWPAFLDWQTGKGRVLSDKTKHDQKSLWDRLRKWAVERGYQDIEDIDVAAARAYIASLRAAGRKTKTLRNMASILGHIWTAVGQLRGGIHNPWQAAKPDDDGTSVRLESFTAEEEERVLAAARRVGNDWYLASIISRWTGLRYGDVAHLEWGDVDMERQVIETVPNKTRRHTVRVLVPLAPAIIDALAEIPPPHEGFILPRHANAYPITPEPLFSAVLDEAGVDAKSHTFHSWRHTFRTRLAEAGVSDEVSRRLGGWTNLKMAAHYDHAPHLAEMREAIQKMASAQVHN